MAFLDTETLCLKPWDASVIFAHVQKPVLLSLREIQSGIKTRELDELRKQYIQAKGYHVIEMYECDWRNMYKADNIVKQHLRESFPYKMPPRE